MSILRSYVTWGVLLPTEGEAQKFAAKIIVTKFYRLQPEYMGSWRIKVQCSHRAPGICTRFVPHLIREG